WYGYYRGWFTPYPIYRSGWYWLTDYLISAYLEAAYLAHVDAVAERARVEAEALPEVPGRAVQLSPEVKEMIAEEVRAQLAAPQARTRGRRTPASAHRPDALNPAPRVFIVSSSLDVSSADGECGLTPGDVLLRLADVPDENQNVTASVQSTKPEDCAPGQIIAV